MHLTCSPYIRLCRGRHWLNWGNEVLYWGYGWRIQSLWKESKHSWVPPHPRPRVRGLFILHGFRELDFKIFVCDVRVLFLQLFHYLLGCLFDLLIVPLICIVEERAFVGLRSAPRRIIKMVISFNGFGADIALLAS